MRQAAFPGSALALMLAASALASALADEGGRYPPGADVPPVGEAIIADRRPEARMVDDSTCELIAAVRKPDGSILRKDEGFVILYRGERRRQFAVGTPREDGLVVMFFPAEAGERIIGRARVRNSLRSTFNNRYAYGPPVSSVCHAGSATVGEPVG